MNFINIHHLNIQNLSVSFKSDDNQYLIYDLAGFDFIENEDNKCFDKVSKVSDDISKVIKQIEKYLRLKAILRQLVKQS